MVKRICSQMAMSLATRLTPFVIALGMSLLAVALFGLTMTTRAVATPAAPTFMVNSIFDAAADLSDTNYSVCRTATFNSTCTLRAAIMKANRYAGGGVTINIPAGAYTLTIPPAGPNDDLSGDLNITQSVTIAGAGALYTFIDGNAVDRVFRIQAGPTVAMSALTIRNGRVPHSFNFYDGGGIWNQGVLMLNNSVISGSEAYINGGGIANSGTLTVNGSVISGNHSASGGGSAGGVFNEGTATLNNSSVSANDATQTGGIVNSGSMSLNNVSISANISAADFGGGSISNEGTLTMNNSSISANRGGIGAGLYNGGTATLNSVTINANTTDGLYGGGGIYNASLGTLTLNNSTLSANSTTGGGGGIANAGAAHLFHVTVAGNVADRDAMGGGRAGGGISNTVGTVELWNTLLTENYQGSTANDCAGDPLTSQDYNYIQTTAGCTLGGTTTHNIYGGDALLGPLQDNGGATQTRALWVGSPAIDQIAPAQCRDSYATAPQPDQRGVTRPVNGLCDIGAYEGTQATPLLNRNLIRNGTAENSAGSPTGAYVGAPNWLISNGHFTVVPYNAPGGFPSVPTDTVPANHGYNFFAGGNLNDTVATQFVDLAPISPTIDAHTVLFTLSADLGGFLADDDAATLTATFLDETLSVIGTPVTIGPVLAADRGSLTGFRRRSVMAPVPSGARTVEIDVRMIWTAGYNDGYADNLSLVLTGQSVFLPIVVR